MYTYNSTGVVDPDATLMHNLVGNRAYDRQVVTFQCVITGVDTVLNWISDDYIGVGGDVLQLASADPVGQTASNPRNPTTIATLVSTSRSSGVWSLFYAKNTSLDFSFSTVSNQFYLALSFSSTPSYYDHHHSVFFCHQFLIQQSVLVFNCPYPGSRFQVGLRIAEWVND